MMDNEQKGVLLSILSSVFLGLNVIFGKLLSDVVNAETTLVLWFMFASILYITYFVFSGKRKSFETIIKNWRQIIKIGILSTFGSLLWIYGIMYAGPNNVSFIFQFNIIFATLLGVIFLKERFKKIEIFGILLAIIGVFVLTYNNSETSLIAISFILTSAFFYSISNFLSKNYVKKINPVTLSGGRAIFIFLLISIYALVSGKFQLSISPVAFEYALLAAISGAFLGFTLFYKALEKIKMTKCIVLRTVEPFLTIIFSFLILSIIPTVNQLLGGFLIIIGIIILSLYGNKNFKVEK